MKKPLFIGCGTAVITPFDENEQIDFDSLGVLLDRQLAAGVRAIIACGTTGESATLSDLEFDQMISFCALRINGRAPLIAGVGKNSTRHTAELAQSAARLGADGLLVVTPYYNKASQDGLVEHFNAVADTARLPTLLYNVPSRTGMTVAPATYARLAQNPYIIGVKEASGDLSGILAARAACPEDFYFYSGNDDQIVPIMALGGVGVISTAANLVPGEVQAVCQACLAGDMPAAARLQVGLQPLIKALFSEVNPIPLKAALQMIGYDSGVLRLPLTELSPARREALKQTMAELGLL